MSGFDFLHMPSLTDRDSAAYKDWYHLNLFEHRSGRIGLINTSLHGDPLDSRSRALGTALLHDPERGWFGNVEVSPISEANVSVDQIGLGGVAIAVNPAEDRLMASVALSQDLYRARVSARPAARPYRVEFPAPFGSGWISWSALPRLTLSGNYSLFRESHDLAGVSAYHDHNWGRWFWGEDVGWEWGAFVGEDKGPVFVLSVVTDRAHKCRGRPQLMLETGFGRRIFGGGMVEVAFDGNLQFRLRRLPGALAALHQDRVQPWLPHRVAIRAGSGLDWVRIEFCGRAAAQLIAADPMKRGYGFIHEIVGNFSAEGRVRDRDVSTRGLAVFEYVQ